jgi:hypothetical protein
MDVEARRPDFILADDWNCTERTVITAVHVWGSWLDDYLPNGNDPRAVRFFLSFHEDIPASESPTGYSMPGDPFWRMVFNPLDFEVELWEEQLQEGWLTPPDIYTWPADTQCWHYTFPIPDERQWMQRGTPDEPKVYWLDVQAVALDGVATFGWKTSFQHWNDDAVWGSGVEPYAGPWYELVYPPDHQLVGQSIDLAFAFEWREPVGVAPEAAPGRLGIEQNAPNPFNPETHLTYEVPSGGAEVALEVFDVTGRLVAVLDQGFRTEGPHTAVWDGRDSEGRDLASGVYFARLTAGGEQTTVRMVLIR